MRAITVANPGPAYTLALSQVEMPRLEPDKVLIKVAAAGLNRADLLQAKGKYPPPAGASNILGLEVSGVIADARLGSGFCIGEPVVALLTGGGYGEFALADITCVLPLPNGVDPVAGASLPEALFTAWTNLVDAGQLKTGETVLVHGGSSGIGTAAIQLATALGAKVLTTAGGTDRCERCERLGAVTAIDHLTEDFVAAVLEATDGRGADVILDMVGGDYIGRNLAAAAPKGRIVNIAYQKGPIASVDFRPMLVKRLTLTATTLRGRSPEEKGAIRDALKKTVWPLIETGAIHPVIDSTYPLAEAGTAHARLAKGGHFGKILLTV